MSSVVNLPNLGKNLPWYCLGCTVTHNEVPATVLQPTGASSVGVYIVGDFPSHEETLEKNAFVGDPGKLLQDALVQSGITSYGVKVSYAVSCRPLTKENTVRELSDKDIQNCFNNICLKDIQAVQPRVIAILGKTALGAFFPNYTQSMSQAVLEKGLVWNGIPVRVFYHPLYVLKTGGKSSPYFDRLVKFFKDLESPISGIEPQKVNFETHFTVLPDQFPEYLQYINDDEIALDYESTYTSPYSVRFQLAGIGLAGSQHSLYIRMADPDGNFNFSPEVLEQFKQFLLSRKRLIVYNAGFEVPVTSRIFNIDIIDQIYDVLQYGVALNITGKLKEVAARVLEIPPWSDMTGIWISLIKTILEELPKRKYKDIRNFLLENSSDHKRVLSHIENLLKSDDSASTIHGLFLKISDLLKELYKDNTEKQDQYLSYLVKTVAQKIQQGIPEADYLDIPWEVVSKYNCLDTTSTRSLMAIFEYQVREQQCEEAAQLYNEHMKLKCEIESSGIIWDDEKAASLEKVYTQTCLTSLKNLILHPFLVKAAQFTPEQVQEIIQETDFENLKEYFNPNSSHVKTKDIFSQAILTDTLRMAYLIHKICTDYHKSDYILSHPEKFPLFKKFVTQSETTRKSYFQIFSQTVKEVPDFFSQMTVDEKRLVMESHKWKLGTLATAQIEELYSILKETVGVDPDNKDTWNEEFKLLYYFRLFKKVNKSLTSYINGKMGRGQVYIANREQTKENNFQRISDYEHRSVLTPEEVFILQQYYSVNSADTKRWSSFIHTIPWGSELRDIHISRFSDGMLCHWDYKQNEIKYMAYLSGDKSLIDALKNKSTDIHKYIASRMFKIPLKEVLASQRRFAKNAVFSFLFGKGEQSFADDYMKGNLAEARELINNFFTEFPGVKEFIERKHREVEQFGGVKTMFGDFIPIVYDKNNQMEYHGALRKAQNYSIQSSASTGSGACIYRSFKKMKSLGLKVIDFQHDSSTFDFRCKDLITVLKVLPLTAEKEPQDAWGVPITIDIEIGVRGNSLVHLDDIQVSEDMNSFHAEFSGDRVSLEDVVKRLRDSDYDVQLDVTSQEEEMIKMNELFLTRRAYNMNIGQLREKIKGTLRVSRQLTH